MANIRPLPAGGPETILIAEDDEHLRRLTVRILEGAGYTVLAAEDGEHASVLYRENADDIGLAVLDVIMPKKTGVDLYVEIQVRRADLPIIFVTGHGFDLLKRIDPAKTNYVVLEKPYDPSELLLNVRAGMRTRPASKDVSSPS